MSQTGGQDKRRAPRMPIRAKIKFRPVAKVAEATSVDLSQAGIQFETKEPLRILMLLAVGKESEKHMARLIWARRKPDGSMAYGFEFDPEAKEES